jgi:hypothetical protein
MKNKHLLTPSSNTTWFCKKYYVFNPIYNADIYAAFLLVTAASSSSPDMPLSAVVLSAQSSVFGRMFTCQIKATL